jgi:hypothetical protein
MWMRLPIGRPRHHVSHHWPQMEEDDQCPTTAYLWDWVAPVHATQARSYIDYSNELDAFVPSFVSTCISFLTVVTLWL